MQKIFWGLLVLLVLARYVSLKPVYISGQRIRISGRVTSEPLRLDNRQRINLANLKIYLPNFPEINYGDRVAVEGEVDNGILIDAKLVDGPTKGGGVFNLREQLLTNYSRSLAEPHASLVSGIVLGSKSNLPQDFWESLKASGTAHVVVASGMNVTFVAGFLVNTFVNIISRRKAIGLALFGVWIYVALSGFDAPLVRAGLMGSIAFSAQIFGRLSEALRALFLSALAMLIVNPFWVYDLGFILSFLATLSLIVFGKKINSLIRSVPMLFREGLATSLAAQIGVAPILFITFGQFNILSPFINALILWTIAPIMILGAIGGVLGIVYFPLGQLIMFLTYPLTWWFVNVVSAFGN